MQRFRMTRKKALIAAGLLVSTCGVSTYRGFHGADKSNENLQSIQDALDSSKLSPDCLSSEDHMFRAVKPVIGGEAAIRFADESGRRASSYLRESGQALSIAEPDIRHTRLGEARQRLVQGVYTDLVVGVEKTSTDAEKAEFLYLGITIWGLADVSGPAARGLVYGQKVADCIDSMLRLCAEKKAAPRPYIEF